jgi:site-specific recombinase XerD
MQLVSTAQSDDDMVTVLPVASSSTGSSTGSVSTVSDHGRRYYEAAPARFLGREDEFRMNLTNQKLITEAIRVNHPKINKKTLKGYQLQLEHFDEYITSVERTSFYDVKRKHIRLYMDHLEAQGGANPDAERLQCSWCKARGYPDGKSGQGWSASTRKRSLAAIHFLYRHFAEEDDLPDIDPAKTISSPKVEVHRQYTPTEGEVKQLLVASGSPMSTLLANWIYLAPSRAQTFNDAKWSEIDLVAETWDLVGKGRKEDIFALHPELTRQLKIYQKYQQRLMYTNKKVRNALSDPETSYVLLTRNGKKLSPTTISRILKWRAIRANVAVIPAKGKGWDSPGGKTSKVCAHSLRRAWATHALDKDVPLETIQMVLHHKDISTTRRHYAFSKPERAREALIHMPMPEGDAPTTQDDDELDQAA